MPNHVVNHISLRGDPAQIREMLESIKADELGVGSVDFNKIIPMPESLNIEAGSRTERGLKKYKEFISEYLFDIKERNIEKILGKIPVKSEELFLRQHPDIKHDEWELGKVAWNNIQKYGAPTWYEWSISKWGTKWNAYGYDEDMI